MAILAADRDAGAAAPAANGAISVAGGQIIRSALPASRRRPAMILAELGRPRLAARSSSSCPRPAGAASAAIVVSPSHRAVSRAAGTRQQPRLLRLRAALSCSAAGRRSIIPRARPRHRPLTPDKTNVLMLRGIHKASANWLGNAVMGVVLGLLVVSFAHLGHRRHFPRLRPLDRRQGRRRPRSASSSSASSTTTGCSSSAASSAGRSRRTRRGRSASTGSCSAQ